MVGVGSSLVGEHTEDTAREMRESGTVEGHVTVICVSRVVGGGVCSGVGEELFGCCDFWLYLTIEREESRSIRPSWNSESAKVCTGERREVGCGEGSDWSEKRRDSDERGRVIGFCMESLVHRSESFL